MTTNPLALLKKTGDIMSSPLESGWPLWWLCPIVPCGNVTVLVSRLIPCETVTFYFVSFRILSLRIFTQGKPAVMSESPSSLRPPLWLEGAGRREGKTEGERGRERELYQEASRCQIYDWKSHLRSGFSIPSLPSWHSMNQRWITSPVLPKFLTHKIMN